MGSIFSSPQTSTSGYIQESCQYKDKSMFLWRMRQLELANYIVRKMAKVLCLPAENIDYKRLLEDIMTYHSIDGVLDPDNSYEFDLLASDNSLKGPSERINKFAEIQEYFLTRGGRSQTQMKSDMLEYLDHFIRLRDALIKIIIEDCK